MKKLLVSFVTAQLVIGSTATVAFAFDNPARDAAMNVERTSDRLSG